MPRKTKEVHLFYPVGDDEIQVESDDKKLNQRILDLKKKKGFQACSGTKKQPHEKWG